MFDKSLVFWVDVLLILILPRHISTSLSLGHGEKARLHSNALLVCIFIHALTNTFRLTQWMNMPSKYKESTRKSLPWSSRLKT